MRKVIGVAIAATALSLTAATPAFAAGSARTADYVEYRGIFPTVAQCFDRGNEAMRTEPALIGFTCRTHWTGQRELWVQYDPNGIRPERTARQPNE